MWDVRDTETPCGLVAEARRSRVLQCSSWRRQRDRRRDSQRDRCGADRRSSPLCRSKMAYSWDNRVKFVVRYMYDIDNNGYLDKNDFECLAVRTTVIESKGDFTQEKYEENRKVMQNLWNEIADLADFNKDGMVTVDEFKQAVKKVCVGKSYDEFPAALKVFISKIFESVDLNGDGLIGIEEYRVDCCSRSAYSELAELDQGYNKLCSAEDKKKGGIDIQRFQELYAQFIGNPDETIGAVYLFGPLQELS